MDNPVRETTAFVAKNAKDVKINKEKIKQLAENWAKNGVDNSLWPADFHLQTDNLEKLLDYLIVLDSINFCFWAPFVKTSEGREQKERWKIKYNGKEYKGYFALSLALKKFFEEKPEKTNLNYLSKISFKEFKEIMQGGKNLLFLKKRWQIVKAVSRSVIKNYKSSVNFVESANNKFSVLTHKIYKELPGFNDIFSYKGKKVYLFKRAQILGSEIWGAFGGKGLGFFEDLNYLTCFPDYKIPQILNNLGILEYSQKLQKKVNNKILIKMGSAQEVEIRSCTVQAVEILKQKLAKLGLNMPSFQIDWILWNKSKKDKMKIPYHLTKTIFY
jgi:hypothetical protein